MPHIYFEYSDNLKIERLDQLAVSIHHILSDNLPTSLNNCKSRIIARNAYIIGDKQNNIAFLYVLIRILPGRKAEKIQLCQKLILDEILNYTKNIENPNISVEFTEISDFYIKI